MDFRELAALGPYLDEAFGGVLGAAAPTMDLGVTLSIQAVQQGLNLRGYKGANGKPLTVDGKPGTNTSYALGKYLAYQKAKYPAAQASQDGGTFFFLPSAAANDLITSLNQSASGRAILNAPATTPAPAPKTAITVAKPAATKTVATSNASAAQVVSNRAAAAVRSKSTLASRSGLTKVNVGTAQDMMRTIGWTKLTRDGLFGPHTAYDWAWSATYRNLPPEFDRAGPNEAWVDPATLEAVRRAAGSPSVGPKPASAQKPSTGLPTQPSKPGLVKYSVAAAQLVLNKLGARLATDKLFGPGTRAAWQSAASKRKLDTAFDRASSTEAWVHPETQAALELAARGGGAAVPAKKATGEKPAPAPTPTAKKATGEKEPPAPKPSTTTQTVAAQLVKLATISVAVKTLQQAELASNNLTTDFKGRYPGVKDTGTWDAVTEKGFYTFFGIDKLAEAPRAAWLAAMPKLVASNKKSLKVLPEQAAQIGKFAKAWQDYLAQKKATPAKPSTPGPVGGGTAAPSWVLAAGNSTVPVPVSKIQQAINQVAKDQLAKGNKAYKTLKVSGVWSVPKTQKVGTSIQFSNTLSSDTQDLALAAGSFIFAGISGTRTGADWNGYINAVLSSDRKTMKLPPDVAQMILNLTAPQTGPMPVAQPTIQPTVTLGPTQTVTGQTVSPIATPSAQPVTSPVQPEPIPLTPDVPAPGPAPAPEPYVPAPAPAPAPAPDVAPTPVTQPPTDASLTPTAADAAAQPASSGGGLGLFLGLLGVGTLVVVAMNKDEDSPPGKSPSKRALSSRRV